MRLLSYKSLVVSFLFHGSAKSQQPLQANQILSLTSLASSTSLSLPAVNPVALSLSVCSSSNNASPTVSIQNGTGGSTVMVAISEGLGSFQGFLSQGSTLQIDVSSGQFDLDVGVSNSSALSLFNTYICSQVFPSRSECIAPLQSLLDAVPQVGDTTATQGIFFSPVFASSNHISPTFPNYTLPFGELDPPQPPANIPNFTLVLLPTKELPSHFELSSSACAVQNLKDSVNGVIVISPSSINDGTLNVTTNAVLKDIRDGWRLQWLIEGLQPATNYTLWTIQNGGILAGPINALTKSCESHHLYINNFVS